jgi:hypothetical protein
VISPLEVLVKRTVKGAVPLVGLAVKSATGGGTTTEIVLLVEAVRLSSSVTFRVTVYDLAEE